MSDEKDFQPETQALHAGQSPDPTTNARAVPIYQTVAYEFNDAQHAQDLFALAEPGNIYTRIMNPTWDVLEQRITALDGGVAAIALASGQAAVTYSVLNICRTGDNIVALSKLYGGTYNLFAHTLPKMGIKVNFCEPTPEAVKAAITPKTKAVYSETVGNPDLLTLDIRGVADVAHAAGVPLIIDNTIPTPYLVRPIEHGADIVVESLTKFLGGHGTSIGGIVIDSGNFDWRASGKFPMFTEPDPSYHGLVYGDVFTPENFGANIAYIIKLRVQYLRDVGAAISPFNSFLILQGIETLPLRMERHNENALAIARHLEESDAVEWVYYPGLESSDYKEVADRILTGGYGALVTFGVKGGREAGQKFIESLELFSHLANIGDAKSLVIHPASTTHSQLDEAAQASTGVSPDYVRVSVGLETLSDLIADLDQALDKA